jgi:hypothetical protein
MEDLEKKVINDYVNKGMSQQNTAKANNIHYKKVKDILTKNNIHIRNAKEAKQIVKKFDRGNKPTPYTKEQEQKVLYWYVEKRRGIKFCQKQAKCSLNTFNKILKDNNIIKRTYSEAAIASNQNRALHKNENYFDIESYNMAWILGFLAADGNVSKRDNTISIGLSAVDIEILERIKKEIEIENKIRVFTSRQGLDYCELAWTCKRHKDKLSEYSIVPKKTFVLKPPYKLDSKYYLDYIRGYFDGDGSVNFINVNGKKKYTALRWQVCSATPAILEFILDVLESYGIKKVNIQEQHRKDNHILYCIQYSTNATKQIYNILYSTPSTLFLARKKNHFKEIIDKMK